MKVAINFANPFKFDIKSTRGMSPNVVSVIPEIRKDFSKYPLREMSAIGKKIKCEPDGDCVA